MPSRTRRAPRESRPPRPTVDARGGDLARVRRRIDALDERIVELLEQRAELALRAGAVKARTGGAAHEPEREREVLERVAGRASGPLAGGSLRAIYREILRASRALEAPLFAPRRRKPPRARGVK